MGLETADRLAVGVRSDLDAVLLVRAENHGVRGALGWTEPGEPVIANRRTDLHYVWGRCPGPAATVIWPVAATTVCRTRSFWMRFV